MFRLAYSIRVMFSVNEFRYKRKDCWMNCDTSVKRGEGRGVEGPYVGKRLRWKSIKGSTVSTVPLLLHPYSKVPVSFYIFISYLSCNTMPTMHIENIFTTFFIVRREVCELFVFWLLAYWDQDCSNEKTAVPSVEIFEWAFPVLEGHMV